MFDFLKGVFDFFGKLIVSAFSGVATKKIAPKDNKVSLKISGNRDSNISDVSIESVNKDEAVDISENSESTIQQIHIKT